MAPWLRALLLCQKSPDQFPVITWQLTTTCKSGSRASGGVFRLQQTPTHTIQYRQAGTQAYISLAGLELAKYIMLASNPWSSA